MFASGLQINNMNYKYDGDHDVLHLFFGEQVVSYADEIAQGVYMRRSEENESITGMIILDFSKRDFLALQLSVPININFSQIYNQINENP